MYYDHVSSEKYSNKYLFITCQIFQIFSALEKLDITSQYIIPISDEFKFMKGAIKYRRNFYKTNQDIFGLSKARTYTNQGFGNGNAAVRECK
jgi:hypothetical protein